MTAPAFSGSFWPKKGQKLLLRAALLEDERGLEAWRQLRPEFDIDELDLGEQRLLPLVYQTLRRLGADDPALPRLRGLYRRTWYLNQLLLDRHKEALRVVAESEGAPVVVNSWELPVRYYGDLGLRPVEQMNLLVRRERVASAARALSGLGWSGPLEFSEAFLRGRHSASYRGANGDVCVLTWRLFHEFTVPGSVEPADLFEPAIEFELGEIRVRGLCPADELLDVCVAGARMSHWPSLSWIADALAVLRAPESAVEWERLVAQAKRLRATLRVYDALSFIRQELECDVPDEILDELRSVPARPRELLAHKVAGTRLGALGPVPETLTRFLRLSAEKSIPRAVAGVPGFLRDEWGLERRAQIPVAAVRRGGGVVLAAARMAKLRRDRHAARSARAASPRER